MLSFKVAFAQRPASAPTEPITIAITVQASDSVAQTAAGEFLSGFINTAAQMEGPKLMVCVTNAAKLRPDLAAKITVYALNIAHLNSHLLVAHLSWATIDQIVRAAVTGAPQSAASIVKAAIESEPYARSSIVAAALASAPGEESEISAAASETSLMSTFASAGTVNPVYDLPLSSVNSPEQPPSGP